VTGSSPSSRGRLLGSHRPTGIAGTGVGFFQLGFEPVELRRRHRLAVAVNQRAGRACTVIQKRLVPLRGLVVDVDRRGGGLADFF
jgi:hypothetical protein